MKINLDIQKGWKIQNDGQRTCESSARMDLFGDAELIQEIL